MKRRPVPIAFRRTAAAVLGLLPLLTALAFASSARAEANDPTAALARAQAAYDTAIGLKASKPAEARAAFAESAAIFQGLVDDGADTAGLRFNLGNAYVQAGDLGRGIANYLRARQLAPYDAAILANLATARTDVQAKIAGDAVNDGSRIGWWRFVGERTRLGVALVGWFVFWGLVALPLVRGRAAKGQRPSASWLRGVRGAALLVAFLSGSTVAIDRWLLATRPLGVIVGAEVVVRKGNGEGFEAQVAEKLGPGVECMVLERRPGWTRIRLADGTEGWVPEHDLVSV